MKKAKLPQVSVVIPCYNHGKYIAESVDSVLAQTFQNFEIIITDDASNDGATPLQIKAAAKKDKRIRVCTHAENRGLPATRNTAIEAARGKYILPLDSDDKIAATYLQKTVRHLEKTKADIVYTHLQCFGERTNIAYYEAQPQKNLPFKNVIPVCSLYKRSIWREVGGYNDNMRDGYEDWDFWLGCMEKNKKFSLLAEALFFYRIRNGSMVTRADKIRYKLIRQIKKNHPSLYQWHNYYFTWQYVEHLLHLLRLIRRGIVRIRWQKDEKIIHFFKFYLIDTREKPL